MNRAGYVPNHLKKAASEIRKAHTVSSSNVMPSDEEIKNFINEVCTLPANRVEGYSSLLSKRRLLILAEYITHNSFDVNLENVRAILECRVNGEIFRTVYKGWQNEYHAYPIRECREFLLSAVRNHRADIGYIKEHDLNSCFEMWMNSKLLGLEVGVSLLNFCNQMDCDISDAEKHFDIAGSYLAREATKWYYCCCDAKVYLGMNDRVLHAKVKDFETELTNRFLRNLLEKLTVKQLAAYNLVWEIARINIGEPYSKRFILFFSEAGDNSEIIKNKYLEWRFLNQIDIIFGGDYRSQFWKGKVLDYDATDYETKKLGEVLIMIFGDIYVLEFKSVGPVYFFTKEYYKENIERLFDSIIIYSLTEIKSILYNNHTDMEGFTSRYTHHGDWEFPVSLQLKRLLGK